ncbi:Paxillin-like protein 1 [Yarrowia sp. C11]|nr:Paxillin-like protein 1 [Yarrowia sp. E02]KAG5367617.1 Paxillin-like protein 1 [Yarrowia sp. C11]
MKPLNVNTDFRDFQAHGYAPSQYGSSASSIHSSLTSPSSTSSRKNFDNAFPKFVPGVQYKSVYERAGFEVNRDGQQRSGYASSIKSGRSQRSQRSYKNAPYSHMNSSEVSILGLSEMEKRNQQQQQQQQSQNTHPLVGLGIDTAKPETPVSPPVPVAPPMSLRRKQSMASGKPRIDHSEEPVPDIDIHDSASYTIPRSNNNTSDYLKNNGFSLDSSAVDSSNDTLGLSVETKGLNIEPKSGFGDMPGAKSFTDTTFGLSNLATPPNSAGDPSADHPHHLQIPGYLPPNSPLPDRPLSACSSIYSDSDDPVTRNSVMPLHRPRHQFESHSQYSHSPLAQSHDNEHLHSHSHSHSHSRGNDVHMSHAASASTASEQGYTYQQTHASSSSRSSKDSINSSLSNMSINTSATTPMDSSHSSSMSLMPVHEYQPDSTSTSFTFESKASEAGGKKKKRKTPCRGCNQMIVGKAVSAKDSLSGRWHRECFKCHGCDDDFPSTEGLEFYIHDDWPYCQQCYHHTNNSICSGCGQGIEGECLETTSGDAGLLLRYHTTCLVCATCGDSLCHDEYYTVDGVPLCDRHVGSSQVVEKRQTRMMFM